MPKKNDPDSLFLGEDLSTPDGQDHVLHSQDADEIRRWVKYACRSMQMDPTNLARKAEVVPSTLNRFLNGSSQFVLSSRTITKIKNVAGFDRNVGADDKTERLLAIWSTFPEPLKESALNVLESFREGQDKK